MKTFKLISAIAIGLCLSTLGSTGARADTAAGVRKSLQSLYGKSAQAFQHKDADAACAMYDPDCTIYTQNGDAAGLVAVRDILGKMLDVFQKVSESTTIRSCTIASKDGVESAKVSVVDVKNAVIFTPQGKRLAVRDVITRRDYWEKTEDGWKIKQSRILSDTGSINGKKVKDPTDYDE